MNRRSVFFWLFFFLPAFGCAAQVRFETHTFLPQLEVRAKNQDGSLDLKQSLGIADVETVTGKVTLDDKVRLNWTGLQYEGTKPLVSSDLGDLAIGSSLQVRHGGIGFYAPLLEKENFRLRALFDLKGYRADGRLGASFDDAPLFSSARESAAGVAPTAGFALEGQVGATLSLYGEVAALPLGGRGSFVEGDAGFRYQVRDRAFFQAGYRGFWLDMRQWNASWQVQAQGPYFGLQFDFR